MTELELLTWFIGILTTIICAYLGRIAWVQIRHRNGQHPTTHEEVLAKLDQIAEINREMLETLRENNKRTEDIWQRMR